MKVTAMYDIHHERPEDAARVPQLLDKAFGPDRTRKAVYALREGLSPLPGLSLAATEKGRLVGTICHWPVNIGGRLDAVLLGPVAVVPERKGQGLGVRLIRKSLVLARWYGHRAVVLVGDADYYSRFGFKPAAPLGIEMPGGRDTDRLMVLELFDGALDGISGVLGPGFVERGGKRVA